MPVPRLKPDSSAILVVDVQERLLPHMHNAEQVVKQVQRLIDGANLLNLPILVTEQYRKGLGLTVPTLATRLDKAVCTVEKMIFSACVEPILSTLSRLGCRTVVVCGIEAHVCVLQSCLDLADAGYLVAVAADAIGSRHADDQTWAVQRMVQAQVMPTTVESALFEFVGEAGTSLFKALLPIVK
jgi:nicotinamidase-related amidase